MLLEKGFNIAFFATSCGARGMKSKERNFWPCMQRTRDLGPLPEKGAEVSSVLLPCVALLPRTAFGALVLAANAEQTPTCSTVLRLHDRAVELKHGPLAIRRLIGAQGQPPKTSCWLSGAPSLDSSLEAGGTRTEFGVRGRAQPGYGYCVGKKTP